MNAIKFEVHYFSQASGQKEFSHKYNEDWMKTELFCPECGNHSVWRENGAGDYYVGERYLCTSCRMGFYLPSTWAAVDEQDTQRLSVISPTNET